jgi:hypothetical protein
MADALSLESPFRRSSRCTGGGCVEVALLPAGGAVVRDSGDSARKPLTYGKGAWLHFVSSVKNGEFDL